MKVAIQGSGNLQKCHTNRTSTEAPIHVKSARRTRSSLQTRGRLVSVRIAVPCTDRVDCFIQNRNSGGGPLGTNDVSALSEPRFQAKGVQGHGAPARFR
jgi:hypothetical protein